MRQTKESWIQERRSETCIRTFMKDLPGASEESKAIKREECIITPVYT